MIVSRITLNDLTARFVPQAMTRNNNSWKFILHFIQTYHPGCKEDISNIYSSMTSWGGLTNVVYTRNLKQFKSLMVNFNKILSLKHFLPWTTQAKNKKPKPFSNHQFQCKG